MTDPAIRTALRRLGHAPKARARLNELLNEKERRFAARSGLGDRLREAMDDLRHARRLLRAAEERRQYSEDRGLHDSPVGRAAQNVKIAEREHERLQALAEDAEANLATTSATLSAIVEFLASLPDDARVIDHEPAPRRGAKPGDLNAAIAGVRAQISDLGAEIVRVERALVPAADAKARAAELVDALIAEGRPDVRGLLSATPAPLRWPTVSDTPLQTTGYQTAPALNVPAMLAWLAGRKTMLARLEAEIDALADDAAALPAERGGLLAELRAKLLDAERREAALLDAAAEAGLHIEPRADMDPAALLSIEIQEAAAAEAAA